MFQKWKLNELFPGRAMHLCDINYKEGLENFQFDSISNDGNHLLCFEVKVKMCLGNGTERENKAKKFRIHPMDTSDVSCEFRIKTKMQVNFHRHMDICTEMFQLFFSFFLSRKINCPI